MMDWRDRIPVAGKSLALAPLVRAPQLALSLAVLRLDPARTPAEPGVARVGAPHGARR
jgi:hypothetical protein